MHQATRRIPPVPKMYASQVPFPASVNTKGIVTNGVSVGQAPGMDCGSVSSGDRDSFRRPKPPGFPSFSNSPKARGGFPVTVSSGCPGVAILYKSGFTLPGAKPLFGGVIMVLLVERSA